MIRPAFAGGMDFAMSRIRIGCLGVFLAAAGFPVVGLSVAGAQTPAASPDKASSAPTLPPAPQPTSKFPGNDLNGIGPVDHRTDVDQGRMPWRAIGRLQTKADICTAALVAPAVILTAAHCLFDARARRNVVPDSIDFKLGYLSGKFDAEARGVRIVVSTAYDPVLNVATMGNDWSLVELDQAIGVGRFLEIHDGSPQAGAALLLGGYSKDHGEKLMADLRCHAQGLRFDKDGTPLIRHDCSGTHGVSGAPLLIGDTLRWEIVGIDIAGSDESGGLATLALTAKAELAGLKPTGAAITGKPLSVP